jgi:hypothetical protein
MTVTNKNYIHKQANKMHYLFQFIMINILYMFWAPICSSSGGTVYTIGTQDGIHNIPDWCHHLYSTCGSAKHWYMIGLPCLVSQSAKLHIAGWMWAVFTWFIWSCVCDLWWFSWWIRETNSECAAAHRHRFWWNTKCLSSPTHCTPLIWHPVTSSYFQKLNWSWKDTGFIPLRRSRLNHRECLTLWEESTSRKRSKNGGGGGTSVYMQEGAALRIMAANRP